MNKELEKLVGVIKEEDKIFCRSDKECEKIAKNMIGEINEIKETAEKLAKENRCENKFENLFRLYSKMCNFSSRYKHYVNFENSRKRWKVQDKILKMILQKKYNGYKEILEELSSVMSEQINVGEESEKMLITCTSAAICPKCKNVPVIFKGKFTKQLHCPKYCNVIKNVDNRFNFNSSKSTLFTNDDNVTNQQLIDCWNNSI